MMRTTRIEIPRDSRDTTGKWARLEVLVEVIPHEWQSGILVETDIRITVRGNDIDTLAALRCRIPEP